MLSPSSWIGKTLQTGLSIRYLQTWPTSKLGYIYIRKPLHLLKHHYIKRGLRFQFSRRWLRSFVFSVCDMILSSKDLWIFWETYDIYLYITHGNSTLKLEVSGSSETVVNLYHTTRSHIPEEFIFLSFLVTKHKKTRRMWEDELLIRLMHH